MRFEDGLPQPIAAALADGRLTETNLMAWCKKYERDPEGTAATLAGLAPGPAPDRMPQAAAPEFSDAQVRHATDVLTGRRRG